MADRNPIRKVVARIIRWAAIEATGTDEGPYQVQQVSYMQRSGRSAAIYPYGFNALAPAKTLAIMATISGQSDNRAHMPMSGPNRVKLKPGEVVVYHPATGAKAHFKADGSIEVESPVKVKVTAPLLDAVVDTLTATLTGAATITAPSGVTITGDETVTGDATLGAALNHDGSTIGFYAATPVAKPTITGGDPGSALRSLLDELELMGLLTDTSTGF